MLFRSLQLVDCQIRHLGTELAQELYGKIQQYLIDHGVEIRFGMNCCDLIIEENICKGAVIAPSLRPSESETVLADRVIVCAGRKGADWLEKLCGRNGVDHVPGTVDVGVRVEVRNEIMEDVNKVLYLFEQISILAIEEKEMHRKSYGCA